MNVWSQGLLVVHINAIFKAVHQRVEMDCCIGLTTPITAKLAVRCVEEYLAPDVTVGGELKDQTKHVISTPTHKVVLTTGSSKNLSVPIFLSSFSISCLKSFTKHSSRMKENTL